MLQMKLVELNGTYILYLFNNLPFLRNLEVRF